jgi:uracil-DNA glycosylase
MDPDRKWEMLRDLYDDYEKCDRCDLCEPEHRVRQNVVFGEGSPNADLMIIGEGPGESEDLSGQPFQGPAGDLLNKLLTSHGIDRETDAFITNCVLCRPTEEDKPGKNRKPAKEELAACRDRLHKTINIVDPHVILLLGNTALKALTTSKQGITSVARNDLHPRLDVITQGIYGPVTRIGFATFHPSYLLRNDAMFRGSDMHLTYLTIRRSMSLIDHIKNVYYGTTIPDRGYDDDDELP